MLPLLHILFCLRGLVESCIHSGRCNAGRYEYNSLQAHVNTIKCEGEEAFAAINGWRIGQRYSGRGWADHSIRFHKKRHLVAIIGQPYGGPDQFVDELNAYAREHDMCLHVPPMTYASIWFPGSTLFYVM